MNELEMGNCTSFSTEYSISFSQAIIPSVSVLKQNAHELTTRYTSHLIKNNRVAPVQMKTQSDDLCDDVKEGVIDVDDCDDGDDDRSTFSLIQRGMKNLLIDTKVRRGSTWSATSLISALTMDDAMHLLDQELMSLASHRLSHQHHHHHINDDGHEGDDDDDEVRLTKEMMQSYLMVISDESANISDLLHQLHQIDVETQEHPHMSPRDAQIQREKRDSLVSTLREEFRLAMITTDAQTI